MLVAGGVVRVGVAAALLDLAREVGDVEVAGGVVRGGLVDEGEPAEVTPGAGAASPAGSVPRSTPQAARTSSTTATSRSYYNQFWSGIDRVQVSQVTSEAPSSVVATLRYDYADGRTFIERTSYSLVPQGGQLKIDRSTVLSSRQI